MPSGAAETLSSAFRAIGRHFLKRLEMPRPSYERRIINNMNNLYRVVHPGDILLVEGQSKLSQIIQLLTKSSWSHVAFYVGDRLKEIDNGALKHQLGQLTATERKNMLIEADAGNGVAAVPLSKYKDYNIRISRPFGISMPDLNAVIAEVVANIGKHYDHENLLDLALLALPFSLNPFKQRTIQACLGGCTEYKVICSGMIAKAFQSVGYPIVPALLPAAGSQDTPVNNPYGSKLIMRHYSQIVPRDFDLSPNFDIIKYNIVELGTFDYRQIWGRQ